MLALAAFLGGQALAEEPVDLGRALTSDFYEGRLDSIWSRMTPELREAIGSEAALGAFGEQIENQLGAEETVISERVDESTDYNIYLRTADHAKSDIPVLVQWTLTDDGDIAGFFIRPVQKAAQSRFLDYKTKAELRLPFEGEWYVYWGGRAPDTNYHAVDPAQRFALDLVIRRGGSTHEGDGSSLDDYYCWDAPIIAPASGTVEVAVDGLPDQQIGSRDPKYPAGNHVVLRLDDGEYAFLAHMRQGSVTVEQGERVEQGDELGRCGNSGNTSEPHLHFHLQTTPDLRSGEGLPAQFQFYVADGKAVERGEPIRGQTIRPG